MKLTILSAAMVVGFAATFSVEANHPNNIGYQMVCIHSESDGTGVNSESDGTGVNSESDGTGVNSESDGTGIKSYCMINEV